MRGLGVGALSHPRASGLLDKDSSACYTHTMMKHKMNAAEFGSQSFHQAPPVVTAPSTHTPRVIVVDRWDAAEQRWLAVRQTWNGERYVRAAS